MQKITPFLWFDGQAEEAARFYTSIFKKSKIETISPMSATFRLDGVKFIALNGGPQFKFTEAISFFVSCKTQKEIDYFVVRSPSRRALAQMDDEGSASDLYKIWTKRPDLAAASFKREVLKLTSSTQCAWFPFLSKKSQQPCLADGNF
jgi:predicted 3-demethylubiquinone-9 3-methyltransferase (glyoxalase superfamily)